MTLDRRAAAALDRLLPEVPERLGVAVSGGGDSMALLHLCHAWGAARGVALAAITVDHGLRPEAAAEAALAAQACAALGVPHETRAWSGWDGRGNLQDAARQARRALIADWAAERGVGAVALGHTLDDQAETVLMRLARGSGVDGLSGMAEAARDRGTLWLRPLLEVRRDELRAWLRRRDIPWADDPSNADDRFARVRARAILAACAPLGLDAPRLARTARSMRRARAALAAAAQDLAARAAEVTAGAVALDRAALAAAPEETRLRVIAGAIGLIGGRAYRPRLDALEALAEAGTGTLHGCRAVTVEGRLWIAREAAAVADLTARPGAIWDRRWRVTGPRADAAVGALGPEGLAACPGWPATGLPAAVLEASPAVRDGADLVAAPVAAPDAAAAAGWRAAPVLGACDLAARLGAH
ncbi:tRNA lysidine(34) synthetase TilS [Rhodosalinus sediminis]|uniref:tRNA lysidine(34) synthetase TilS n=1 Tax=Rhodosalinus sediminis TaxID=1940533 RepID=UPI002355D425|nr:tRNA lysidine(34) synthetase TilS [Rhodosalinus sediminis]